MKKQYKQNGRSKKYLLKRALEKKRRQIAELKKEVELSQLYIHLTEDAINH